MYDCYDRLRTNFALRLLVDSLKMLEPSAFYDGKRLILNNHRVEQIPNNIYASPPHVCFTPILRAHGRRSWQLAML